MVGPDADLQIVTFPVNRGRETFVFATTSQDDWVRTMPVTSTSCARRSSTPRRARCDACESVTKLRALCARPAAGVVAGTR